MTRTCRVGDIEIASEFNFTPVADRQALVERVLSCRDSCIGEADKMFDQGFYGQYLHQFGHNCRDLPDATRARIAKARRELASQ